MRSKYSLWVLVLPLLVACGPDEQESVSGQSLALTARENVEGALRGLYAAGSFVADSAALAEVLSPLAAGSSDCDAVAPACPPGQVCPVTPIEECEPQEVSVEDLQESRDGMNEAIDDLVTALRDEIFTAENLESEDATSATYLLGASTLCADSLVPPATPPGSPPAQPGPDPDCVDEAGRMQLRLRLTQPSPGDVDVQLLMTSARHNPATLELHDDHVALVVDLGEVKSTLDALGEDSMQLTELSGVVALEIVRYAALDYGLRYSVREDVHVGVLSDDGDAIDVSLGSSIPTGELRLDGNARQLTGSYDLGFLRVTAPLSAFMNDDDPGPSSIDQPPPAPKVYTGTIAAFLAGFEGSVTLDGSKDELDLTNLGLGDASSTLEHDGTLVARVDVNPDGDRHFDVHARKTDDGGAELSFSPNLDLRVLLNFASLAGQLEDLPPYALGDTLRVFLDGSPPSVKPEDDALRVVSGTLNLTSDAVPSANVSVPAGSCLIETEAMAPAQHELLSQFAAGACP